MGERGKTRIYHISEVKGKLTCRSKQERAKRWGPSHWNDSGAVGGQEIPMGGNKKDEEEPEGEINSKAESGSFFE